MNPFVRFVVSLRNAKGGKLIVLMKTIVLYHSMTGNTKAYAEDLAKRVNADILPLKKAKGKKLAAYDTVVFGGWTMGGTIQGLDKFLQNWDYISDKNVIVFTNGMGFPTKESRAELIETNVLGGYHIRFYQLRGSFDLSKLKFPYNLMMKKTIMQMANDPAQQATYAALQSYVEQPLVFYDYDMIERMATVINGLSIEA